MPPTSNTTLTQAQLENGIRNGQSAVLAKAITLAESTLEADRRTVDALLHALLPRTGQSLRIAVTGVPGAGKSTFIEVFGSYLADQKKKVAVLAIDPTSQKTRGSILGDKTRMEQLSRNPNVFIRPSPSSLALGGVSFHTRESILLCEAAGYDVVLIETVGVGQSETHVRGMVDFFLLLMLTGAGDELQGIKKGILEMADAVVIAKADGENVKPARQAMADVQGALHLQAATGSGWNPKVLSMSAVENKGIAEIWQVILDYEQRTRANGYFDHHRNDQKRQWVDECLESNFRGLLNGASFQAKKERLMSAVLRDDMLPSDAAARLWEEISRKGR